MPEMTKEESDRLYVEAYERRDNELDAEMVRKLRDILFERGMVEEDADRDEVFECVMKFIPARKDGNNADEK